MNTAWLPVWVPLLLLSGYSMFHAFEVMLRVRARSMYTDTQESLIVVGFGLLFVLGTFLPIRFGFGWSSWIYVLLAFVSWAFTSDMKLKGSRTVKCPGWISYVLPWWEDWQSQVRTRYVRSGEEIIVNPWSAWQRGKAFQSIEHPGNPRIAVVATFAARSNARRMDFERIVNQATQAIKDLLRQLSERCANPREVARTLSQVSCAHGVVDIKITGGHYCHTIQAQADLEPLLEAAKSKAAA